MNPYEVLVRPLLSEKSNRERESGGKYSFEVLKSATKSDVKAAIEKMFDVKVEAVRTTVSRGKFRRRGQYQSARPVGKKKAIVTLAEGAKISLFEDL